jgi:hypothetical protein
VKKLTIQLALAATLMGAAIAYAADLGPLDGGQPDRSRAQEHRGAKVKIHGHVRSLYPGARKRMRVTVRNRHSRPVRLRQLRTRVLDAGPGCSRGYLKVRRFKRRRYIPPHARVRVRVRARLTLSAPDACQGARWPLRFRAGVRGGR